MHGLDRNTDLGFFIGKVLTQLALGQFEFQLRFWPDSPNVHISVQCRWSITKNGIESDDFECEPFQAKELYALLGKKIENWSIGADGELNLIFEGGYMLTIFDSNAVFESYVIWNEGDFYAV